jgi:hypothetical protein
MSHRSCRLGHVHVTRWEAQPTDESWTALLREVAAMRAEVDGPLLEICIIGEGSAPPPDPLRRRMIAEIDEFLAQMQCVIWVVEGEGLLHGIKVGVLTWMLAMRRLPVRVLIRHSLASLCSDAPPDLSIDWDPLVTRLLATGYARR